METNVILTARDLETWRQDGFWLSPVIIAKGQLDRLKAHTNAVLAGRYDRSVRPLVDPYSRSTDPLAIQNTDNAHWADSAIRELAFSRTIGSITAQLMKVQTIRLWATQALSKPPGGAHQSQVGWHQDMSYWHCAEPAELLTAWVPLQDVDETNGCLQFVAGSHLWDGASQSFFFEPPSNKHLQAMLADPREVRVVNAEMRAGRVSFHHCLTWHASGPNLTPVARQAISIHLMSGQVCYCAGSDCDEHINVKLLNARHGYPFSGRYFPVVFSA